MDRWMNKQLNGYKNQGLKLNKNKENLSVFLFLEYKGNHNAYGRNIPVATITTYTTPC